MTSNTGIAAPLTLAGMSHPGLVREMNEDAMAIDATLGFVLLADGMGGHASGEVASRVAVTEAGRALSAFLPSLPPTTALVRAFEAADFAIIHEALEDASHTGMGTTLIAGLFVPGRLLVAHVGDSRAYRLRGRVLRRLTRDHSAVQDFIDEGVMTEDEARASGVRSALLRALGTGGESAPEMSEEARQDGDVWLFCSDGLTDLVPETSIARILATVPSPKAACAALVDAANQSGGRDNITVIVARQGAIPERVPDPAPDPAPRAPLA